MNIVITGASKGIGYALSKHFFQQGHTLVLIARNTEFLAQEFSQPNVHCFNADLTQQDILSVVERVQERLGCIDVLINNAGGYVEEALIDMSIENIDYLLNLNLRNPIMTTKAFLPMLLSSNTPLIINLSSISAYLHPANQAVYAATKAGLSAFANALSKEHAKLRVTCLHPSGVNTWNAEDDNGLLAPNDIAELIGFIIDRPAYLQMASVNLSAIVG